MEQAGRLLMVFGVVATVAGLMMSFGPRMPFRIGRLPLDFHFQRDNFSFYLPLGTSILLSVILTLLLSLFGRK